jgi:hypothetical protein
VRGAIWASIQRPCAHVTWIDRGRNIVLSIMRRAFACLLFSLWLTWTAKMLGQNPILGILEDVPGVRAGEPNSRHVRLAFQKDGRSWRAFPSNCRNEACLKTVSSQYPREVVWTIAFDGRSLGKVTGRTPQDFHFYSHVGLQEIVDSNPVPTVGKQSSEYGSSRGAPVYRPLVANSQPYFKDPESWKPSQPSDDLMVLLRQYFRRKFPKLCKNSKPDETKLELFLYRAEDVKLVKAYSSTKGWTVARLHLGEAIDCNDVEAGFEIDDPWFAVDPQESVQYLDAGLWLVDAGDYDNDGKSELVFAINRDNEGGYELFYNNFKSHAVFKFDYH